MKTILLIGAGAIGCRHLQACALLPAAQYSIFVVEPADDRWAMAQAAWEQAAAGGEVPALTRMRTIGELPQMTIDVAVVATQAGIRASVTRALIEQCDVRGLVLEKVLFQRMDEYAGIGAALAAGNIPCWVNCARRMWPAYIALKAQVTASEIAAIAITGTEWDIGCNGIHFLDLCAFLLDCDDVVVDRVTLEPPRPAKRPGLLHLLGRFEARILPSGATPVPVMIESRPGDVTPMRIRLSLRDGDVIEIEEQATSVIWARKGRANASDSGAITFQSRLTNALVEQIAGGQPVQLATYASSRRLHEAMLGSFSTALRQFDASLEQGFCPVT